ncbi:hypothetical protein JHS3_23260 [Jeongeupia sp. HS-3]|uniref:hypothetical protein n=1 Tax=Jeongeupia sp. HS-3 TaxID=1009682 RepID=UPI0018A5DB70|nr:hypothetical protein [Jeongeupia sp. HS-3]BCL76590.1 hypothetical protein JHS3_23260 [Jeongeupia sp. HS-3]
MQTESFIPGKDAALESPIRTLAARGFRREESSWFNPVEGARSVHVRDRDYPILLAADDKLFAQSQS